MGRELQKAKRRALRPKARRDKKSTRKIFNNPIIAANYDPKQTLAQNYRRLGLATKLNDPTGGTEKTIGILEAEKARKEAEDGLAVKEAVVAGATEAKIERDPVTGRILRVIEPLEQNVEVQKSGKKAAQTGLNDPLNALDEDAEDDEEFQGFDDHLVEGHIGRDAAKSSNPILQQLEAYVAQLQSQPKSKRKQSEREIEWVRAMVEKHGDDYDKMFRDRKLNVMQQSKGDIARRVRKYLDGPTS